VELARSALVPLLGSADLDDKGTGCEVDMGRSGTAEGGCPGVPCSWVVTSDFSIFTSPLSAPLLVVPHRRSFLGEELLGPEASREPDDGGARVPLLFGVVVKIAFPPPSESPPVCTSLPWMMVKLTRHRKDETWNIFQTYI